MNLAEEAFYLHLKDPESIRFVILEGIEIEMLPTEGLHPVWLFAKRYFIESGQMMAPTPEVFEAEFPDRMKDHELDIHQDPEESIEWAIKRLKTQAVYAEVMPWLKDFASRMATAVDTDDRIDVLAEGSTELLALATSAMSQAQRVEAQAGTERALRDYVERSTRGDVHEGMCLGFAEIDRHINRIWPGELAVWAAPPKVGKAQRCDEPVLTPSGWVRVDQIQVGDYVIGSTGRPIRVLATHRWQNRPVMRVSTDDGGSLVVDENHEWTIHPHGQRSAVVETKVIKQKIETNKRYAYLPVVGQVQFSVQDGLPIDPYLLGALLGDGCFRGDVPTFMKPDEWLHQELAVRVPGGDEWASSEKRPGLASIRGTHLRDALDQMGLWGLYSHEKFIPSAYMSSSVDDRRLILAGLMDTDGGVEGKSCSFSSSSEVLAAQVRDLILSLGGTARVRIKRDPKFQGGIGRDAHIVFGRLDGCPFRLPRKVASYEDRGTVNPRPPTRRIVSIEDAGVADTVCLTVDAADGLYVAKDFLVTHNSYGLAFAALANFREGRPTCLFTLENTPEMTIDRIACMAAGVDSREWQRGSLGPSQLQRVDEWIGELTESDVPFWIIQPDLGQRSFEAMVAEARARDAEALIIDQLTFVEIGGLERQPKHERIGNALHSLKGMISTGRNRIPCLLAHQINREGTKAAQKLGWLEMYHLAEASEVERTADHVFGSFASRDDLQVQQVRFQMLACRRERLSNWQLNWRVGNGQLNVIREIQNMEHQ